MVFPVISLSLAMLPTALSVYAVLVTAILLCTLQGCCAVEATVRAALLRRLGELLERLDSVPDFTQIFGGSLERNPVLQEVLLLRAESGQRAAVFCHSFYPLVVELHDRPHGDIVFQNLPGVECLDLGDRTTFSRLKCLLVWATEPPEIG